MVFSSQTFLFFFLPLAGLCVLIRSKPVQNALLLIASLIFYAWGEPKMVVLMVLVTLIAYGSGFAIVHFKARPRAKKAVLIASVVVILGNLVVFKYLNFLCRTFSFLGLSDPGIALPIGISFYTFQILSYVIDLYRGKIALQRNFFYLLMYISFFPQLIAGPIVRYETVEQEIRSRSVTMDDLAHGFRRFVVGLAKKLLLANQVAQVAAIIYGGDPANYGSLMYWLAAIAYTLQIYFDFSGYSDMAIGLGRMFGFHFLENFNYPYVSLSVTEFWRRWHISLSTCGITEKFDALAERDLQLTLSVSLHAPDDETRSKIMPTNRGRGVEELMRCCRRYYDKTGRRISFEYAMIDGVNDTEYHARLLAKRAKAVCAHVNLIPLNHVEERQFAPSTPGHMKAFIKILEDEGVNVTVRRKLGGDVDASCGQLRRKMQTREEGLNRE